MSLQQAVASLIAKRTSLLEERLKLRTLALGSSHGDCAFDPHFFPDSVNLCSTSQDLRNSALIYERCAKLCPRMERLVLFYSVFSTGLMLEKTNEKHQGALLREVYNLDVSYAEPEMDQICRSMSGQLAKVALHKGFRGFVRDNGGPFMPASMGAAARAAGHLKNNARSEGDLYLVRLLLHAGKLGHKVTIVIPPVRSDYRAALGKTSEYLFRNLLEIRRQFSIACDYQIINLLDSIDYPDEEFGDYDHLFPQGPGPERFTRFLLEQLCGNAPTDGPTP